MFPQLTVERRAIACRIMHDAAKLTQPKRFEAILYHIDGRSFVADKEHALATRKMVANDVRDGLALARAGWPMDDQCITHSRVPHRRRLAGIGVRHEFLIGEVTCPIRWRLRGNRRAYLSRLGRGL